MKLQAVAMQDVSSSKSVDLDGGPPVRARCASRRNAGAAGVRRLRCGEGQARGGRSGMPSNASAAGSPGCRQASAAPRGNGSRGGVGRIEGMPPAKPAVCRGWLLPHLQQEEAAAGRTTQQDILQPGPWRCAAAGPAIPVPAAPVAPAAPAPEREHPAAAGPRTGMPAAASRALNSTTASPRIWRESNTRAPGRRRRRSPCAAGKRGLR
jgi:hypothetical protein